MSEKSNVIGNGLIVLGILLAIVGLIGYFFPEETVVLGMVIATTYPHRDIGTILLVIGIITAVVGAVTGTVRKSDA
ncbi:MAG: hypothetical protein R6W91_01495 [Thermoplasmata archaeon]